MLSTNNPRKERLSPQLPQPSSPSQEKEPQLWFYQSTMPLQFNLLERIRVAFEENLPEPGLELFDSVVFSGFSSSENPPPALMPPPTFLRFVVTLMAHPFHTTQTRKGTMPSRAPATAFQLMQRIIEIIGPENAALDKVWIFDRGRRSVRRGNRELSPSADDAISGELANEESLFSCAEDVWDVVGWAFTCSVLHPARWMWWKNVLECLLLTLERDWEHRCQRYRAAGEKGERVLKESIAVKMLPEIRGTGGYRRVVRAILANGSAKAKEFHPVWEDELLSYRPRKKGRRTLGGFMGEFDGEEPQTQKKKDMILDENENLVDDDNDTDMPNAPRAFSAYDAWGGVTSFTLRQRFLSLLTSLSLHGQFIPVGELHLEYKNNILQLPLSSFSLFTNTLAPISDQYHALLNQSIVEHYLSASSSDCPLNEETLITRYLPFPANTMALVDNAKVAIVLESLLRLLVKEDFIAYTPELEAAVETGIEMRREKAKIPTSRNGKLTQDDIDAIKLQWHVAEESLRLLVRLLKMAAATTTTTAAVAAPTTSMT